MPTLMTTLQLKAMQAKASTQSAVRKVTSKMDGDSQLVVALVLIAVAVGLCFVFRQTITNTMNGLFCTIDQQINALANGSVK